jgi:hypothetical protein
MEDLELFPGLGKDMDSAFTNFSLQASLMLDMFAVLGVKETLVPRRGDVVAQEVGHDHGAVGGAQERLIKR